MENVEDIYPLSPLQESLLGNALSANSDAGFEQTTCFLRGDLDVAAFRRTWQRILDRHTVLRTAFLSRGLDEPLQIVRRRVPLPFEVHDWRHMDAREQRASLEKFLQADQDRGFDPERAPLMRVSLVRLDEQTHVMVWSHHHLILDGWCRALIQREILTFYSAFQEGRDVQLPQSRPFRDYIEWLQKQNLSEARAFWRGLLKDLAEPTPLVVDRLPRPANRRTASGAEGNGERCEVVLPPPAVARLEGFARQLKITPNTILQGAWALLLSRYNGREDIVFGTGVSGRPPDLPQVGSIMGMFINNLPVRVRVRPGTQVAPWLHGIQEQLLDQRRFDYVSPSQLQEWSGAPASLRLFESLVLFQNYPVGGFAEGADRPSRGGGAETGLGVQLHRVRLETSYPLTLVIVPRESWSLRIYFDRSRFAPATVERMLGHLENLLRGITASPSAEISTLPLLSEAERHQLIVEPQGAPRVPPPAEALGGAQMYVLDRLMEPLPIGVPGEVWLGGVTPAQGYFEDPALTAERFLPDPFSGAPGARLLRTGELARWLRQGELESLGPADRHCVIGGRRVHLGEIEAVLRRCADLSGAVVEPWKEPDGSLRLIAYLPVSRESAPDPGALRRYLQRTLPEPMVPSTFAFLGSPPLTPEGWCDRGALPPPEALGADLVEALVAPQTPSELRLLQIWEELFGTRPLGVTDDFFALGGQSLLAIRLRARIRAELGRDLPLSDLLQAPTVRGMAGLLEKEAGAGGRSSLVAIRAEGSLPPLFAIHPAGGGVVCYVELAYRLGQQQPFYGLQAPGWQDDREPVAQIEQLASLYLEEIRKVQPQGPYRLLGWSFGGFVAFEMARRLVEDGEQVELLAILDSQISQRVKAEQDDAEFLKSLLRDDALLAEVGRRPGESFDQQVERLAELARNASRLPEDLDVEKIKQLLRVWRTHRNAARAFRPRPYPGRVALLRATETVARGLMDPTMGWGDLALGGVEIRDVPGPHGDLVKAPWVRAVAEQIREWLAASRSSTAPHQTVETQMVEAQI